MTSIRRFASSTRRASLASASLHQPPLYTPRRSFSHTASRPYQHVLYFGNVLGYQSIDRLSTFPRAWLDSVGVSADVDHGLKFSGASGGANHLLLSYTLLQQPLDAKPARRSTEDVAIFGRADAEDDEGGGGQAETIDVEGHQSTASFPSKIFALGRNTHAQLGLGFTSQEATRGMVTGELSGSGGVQTVATGNGFSFIVTSSGADGSNVFGFGNDTLGQLGTSLAVEHDQGGDPWDISTRSDSGAPQLKLLPLPKRIEIGQGWEVKSLAAGLDHSLMLVEKVVNGFRVQRVLCTGLNADGQLGVTPREEQDTVPIRPLLSRTFQEVPIPLQPRPAQGDVDTAALVDVVCGADTSYARTAGGDLWVWGNSEYGQTFAGVHDRVAAPLFVPNPLLDAYSRTDIAFQQDQPPKARKLVAGGSFAALLDTDGRVWVAGYGPRGQPVSADKSEWSTLTSVDLPFVEDLYCGLEYLVAVTRSTAGETEVYIWGIVPRSISTVPIIQPTRVPYSIPHTPRQKWLDENPRLKEKAAMDEDAAKARVSVEAAACTRDHLLLVINDGLGKHVWAECDQPPREKGTDVTM